MKRIAYLLAALLTAASLFFCQSPETGPERTYLNVDGDSSYTGYSRLWVALIDSAGRDTLVLFDDSLESLEQLRHIRVDPAPEGEVELIILGFLRVDGDRPAFMEIRTFNAATGSLLTNTVPLDELHGVSRPPRITLLAADSGVKAGDTLRVLVRAEDPDGRIAAVRWFFDDDTVADREYAAHTDWVEAVAGWSYRSAGPRLIAVEVRDNTGNRVRKTLEADILPEGRPALAFSFRDTTISIKDSLVFAAYAMDSNGTVAAYAWDTEGKGFFQPALALEKPADTLRAGRRFDDTGTFTISLRIVDNDDKEARDSVRVKVVLDAPAADAGPDIRATVGDSVRMQGAGRDGMGKIVRFEWSFAGGAFVETDGSFAFKAPADSGAWRCILRVTDDDGLGAADTALLFTAYSGNPLLSVLQPASGEMVPDFTPARGDYALSVPYGVVSLSLKLKTENPHSRVSVSGKPLPAGDTVAIASLQVGYNLISIHVLAEDGKSEKAYALNVTRERNADAALKSLIVNPSAMSPPFAPDSLFYQVTLRNDQTSLTLAPAARDEANARIRVQGTLVVSGNASAGIPIAVGTDTLKVEVTAQDDSVTRVYRVAVRRLPSPDATLKGLSLSAGSLVPDFKDSVQVYADAVPNSVKGIAFRPTQASAQAKTWVAGKPVADGNWSDTLPLGVGENIFAIRVVAETGDIGTYTVQVHRRSANADLASLTVDAGALVPGFRPADTAYADTVLSDSITVTALADPSAKLVQIVLDSPRVAGTSPMRFGLHEGDQRVNVTVTAEEGNTKTYSIRIHRLSRVATLANLAVSPGALSPAFKTATKTYSVTLPNADSVLGFKARPTHALAKALLNGNPVPSDAFSAGQALAVGNNVFRLKVIAESGDSGFYTVTARRRGTNADLKALRVGRGDLAPAFDPGTVAYADSVSAASLTITAIAADGSAQSIRIGTDSIPSDSATVTVALPALGANYIPIKVRAEDGNEKVYALTVQRRTFWKTFGGAGDEDGFSVLQTGDGGFLAAGFTNSSGAGGQDVFLARTDAKGHALPGWPKTFGGAGNDFGHALQATADGGFAVAGYTTTGITGEDAYLLRTDARGEALAGWPKAFRDKRFTRAMSIQQTTDNGFIVSGSTDADATPALFLLRTDAEGKAQTGWPKVFPSALGQAGNSVRQTGDGGFVVAGYSTPSAGNKDLLLLRTDANGDTLPGWPKSFGGSGRDIGSSVRQTADGGFVVAGISNSSGAGDYDLFVLRTDNAGKALPGWPKTFGGAGADEGYCVRQTADGGFIVAGTTESSGAGDFDAYLVRTDKDGNTLPGWPKTFGSSGADIARSVELTDDGGFIVVGFTDSEGAGGADLFLLKLDADGNAQ